MVIMLLFAVKNSSSSASPGFHLARETVAVNIDQTGLFVLVQPCLIHPILIEAGGTRLLRHQAGIDFALQDMQPGVHFHGEGIL